MNVAKLSGIVNHVNGRVPVLVTEPDHKYRWADAAVISVMFNPETEEFNEDHGEELTPEGPEYGRRIMALVID